MLMKLQIEIFLSDVLSTKLGNICIWIIIEIKLPSLIDQPSGTIGFFKHANIRTDRDVNSFSCIKYGYWACEIVDYLLNLRDEENLQLRCLALV